MCVSVCVCVRVRVSVRVRVCVCVCVCLHMYMYVHANWRQCTRYTANVKIVGYEYDTPLMYELVATYTPCSKKSGATTLKIGILLAKVHRLFANIH